MAQKMYRIHIMHKNKYFSHYTPNIQIMLFILQNTNIFINLLHEIIPFYKHYNTVKIFLQFAQNRI